MIIWEIHYQIIGIPEKGVYHKQFHSKSVARRIAMQLYGDSTRFKWWLVGRPLFGFNNTRIIESD